MKFFVLCVFFLLLVEGQKTDEVILSRRKRYVAFPDGSSMIFAFCNTAAVITPFQIFTEGVNWGISYDLPNGTTLLETKKYLKGRRQRRELYNSIETVIDSMGFDGKACIFKTLCEAPRVLSKSDASLAENLLHVLFK
ncbi:unnamed protein product [Brassicogethes aeneus]|uniref:Uncharacterized protein n=1 Tax=Brassicogethes aeneus TaxID=1431903 RepID=A0A9P0B2Y5_BRAAE|nr:unnamed protein product [Brassicogethes aeneus]